jgi:dienelactone hydrolase
MFRKKNFIIPGHHNRPIGADLYTDGKAVKHPVIIYAHGFNGFKDWGNFELAAEQFTNAGFAVISFNFSHNGTSLLQPMEFTDLEAFGQNNYSIELSDLKSVCDWVCSPANPFQALIKTDEIYLVGHSMGGGISILFTAEDLRIRKLVTWAAISECKTPWTNWSREQIDQWKSSGVAYYTNSRTGQQLPMYFQLYEDYELNKERLNIESAIKRITVPVMLIHGSLDTSVPVEKAYDLKKWHPAATLFILETDHVFGRKHPWPGEELPIAMQEVVTETIRFLDA